MGGGQDYICKFKLGNRMAIGTVFSDCGKKNIRTHIELLSSLIFKINCYLDGRSSVKA